MKHLMGSNRKSTQDRAVALKYEKERDSAPRVTAKGAGHLAHKIIELAEQHGIPIKEDPDLVNLLSAVELNQEIPPALYQVVAEILSMIYRVNGKL